MAGSFEGRTPRDRGIEQAIVALKKGAHLLKCGKRGKPKFCPFRLAPDEKMLIWYSEEKEKHLRLNTVSNVVLGQKTVNFLRQRQAEKESQSLSLIYQDGERSLDLICKDKEQAESWFLGLTALISTSHHTRPLSDLRHNQWTSSCANSPAGFMRRRNKLGILQEPLKFSQVRSLYGSPPRPLQDRLFSGSMLDSSEVFFSPRQRTLSDVQSYLDRILPRVPYVVTNNFKDMEGSNKIKEGRMSQTPKTRSSGHGSPVIDRTDALKDVFMWGKGLGGISDSGIKVDFSLPRLLDSTQMLDVWNIACGEKHAALVTKQGEVFCWGEENGGRLGHKVNLDVSYPKVIESLTSICVQTISFGAQHTCAVTSSGELYEWGDSSHGYGLSFEGNKRSQWFPHRVCGPLDGICVSKVACGEWHTAVISSSGQLFTYGDGTFGVLGHGNLQSVSRPKEVESLKGLRVKSVACGPWHTAAVVEIVVGNFKSNTPGGKLFTWGDSDRGRLGHAEKERKLIPTCVASLVDCDFIQVSCGTVLTVALTVTGVVFTMGSSVHGQLGKPQASDASIATVEGLLKTEFVKEISAGSFHVAILTTKGKVFTWGKGADGQLGLGDYIDRNSPALVEALEDRHAESIACGSNFTAAICLHKSMSSKDQSVCSGCRMIFGFTRKKHNCYNCGSVFCHSCSSKKSTKAALAPDRSKRHRVCDPCFTQLNMLTDPGIIKDNSGPRPLSLMCKENSGMNVNSEETVSCETKVYTPRVSQAFKETNLVEGKLSNRQNQDSSLPILGGVQRWGQVACPVQFREHAGESTPFLPTSKKQISTSPFQAIQYPFASKSIPPSAARLKQDLHLIDKILLDEVKRLHEEASMLAEQCQLKSQKLQQYKRKIEETWSLARDEAAKCKAAKEVIKVLTNQMNALSEKYTAGRQTDSMKSMLNDFCTRQPARTELSDLLNKKLVSGGMHQFNDVQILKDRQIKIEAMLLPNAATAQNGSFKHHNGTRSLNKDHNTESDAGHVFPKQSDEVVEQVERGVYVTFTILPGGEKGLKRVRFSRKHFSEKEAQRWWEENQSRVFMKYKIEQMMPSTTNKIEI
ncbi:PH, RCC1 and FYVE domains-containing protein 1 isoform X1 [Typha angustifolia]|uniref:PH, RCC1 and FYVE domains-containing protein 1 isoform X1 n=2 Tax=Typha angustifolia TaxID=59011 RepID=UPI003C2D688B